MATRERPRDRGRRLARGDVQRVADDLRRARVAAGLSLVAVAGGTGMSATQIWRIEHGRLRTVSVDQLARVGAVLGLDVRVRAYPGGDPLRDAGHTRLLDRLRRRLHPRLKVRTEVPLPSGGDPRAWDAQVAGLTGRAAMLPVEAETRFTDAQGQLRRIGLKMRDAGEEYVLLVIADTPSNRTAVAAAGTAIRELFPIPTRRALAALAAGEHPEGSALIFV